MINERLAQKPQRCLINDWALNRSRTISEQQLLFDVRSFQTEVFAVIRHAERSDCTWDSCTPEILWMLFGVGM